jgi:hypothetical protein
MITRRTIRVTFRHEIDGDDYPPDHPIHGFHGTFTIAATLSPGCKARTQCDPDDGWDAEPAEIEFTFISLSGNDNHSEGEPPIQGWTGVFDSMIDNDPKLRETLREKVAEEVQAEFEYHQELKAQR